MVKKVRLPMLRLIKYLGYIFKKHLKIEMYTAHVQYLYVLFVYSIVTTYMLERDRVKS